jgi:hypothetical protein
MTLNERPRTFPPWTIILLQVMWLWSAYLFVDFGLALHSVFHFFMAGLSIFVVIALFMRWRLGFWLSSLAYAAATGGNVARIIANETVPVLLAISVIGGLGLLLIHQIPTSLRWFKFEKFRRVRTWFWCLSALVCIVTEYGFRVFLPNAR